MELVTFLRRESAKRPFTFAADMNAGKRSKAQGGRLKAMGLTPGEADLRLYFPSGVIVHVELKTARGTLSKAQKERHKLLEGLGHEVYTIKTDDPEEGRELLTGILDRWANKSPSE